MPKPTITNITALVAHVRLAGPGGITAEEVAGAADVSIESATKALDLQVQAGLMSSEEIFNGERYVGTVYRMREGAK